MEMAPRDNDRDSRGARARPIKEKNVEGLKKKLTLYRTRKFAHWEVNGGEPGKNIRSVPSVCIIAT